MTFSGYIICQSCQLATMLVFDGMAEFGALIIRCDDCNKRTCSHCMTPFMVCKGCYDYRAMLAWVGGGL